MSLQAPRPPPPYITPETACTPSELASISGNADDTTKSIVVHWIRQFGINEDAFANRINNAVRVVSVGVREMPESTQTQSKLEEEGGEGEGREGRKGRRRQAVVVCETEVEDDMCNMGANMHGGCTTFLIDM
jgi:hypothetical protein